MTDSEIYYPWKESPWISVKDRLPEDFKYVLVYGKQFQPDRGITSGHFSQKWGWYTDCDDQETGERYYDEITHWMPLPNPPIPKIIKNDDVGK